MKTSNPSRSLVLTLALAASVGWASLAQAARPGDLGTLFKVNDEDPKADIPSEEERNAHPMEFGYFLQDLILRAEDAFKNEDYAEASRYYDALAKADPDTGISFRRLCVAQEHLGNFVKAEGYCWALLKRQGATVEDHLHLLRLVLNQFQFSDRAVARLRTEMVDTSIQHLREHLAAAPDEPVTLSAEGADPEHKHLPIAQQVELYSCQLAALLQDATRLEACVEQLRRVEVEPKLIVTFAWALAVAKNDEPGIERALAGARKAGLPEAAIEKLAKGPHSVKPRFLESEEGSEGATVKPASAQPGGDDKYQHGAIIPANDQSVPPSAPQPPLDLEALVAGAAALLGLGAGGVLLWRRSTLPKKTLTSA